MNFFYEIYFSHILETRYLINLKLKYTKKHSRKEVNKSLFDIMEIKILDVETSKTVQLNQIVWFFLLSGKYVIVHNLFIHLFV